MSEPKTTNVEVRLPSRMGFEKVAMSTAAVGGQADGLSAKIGSKT